MTVSEYIKKLETLKEQHGDLEVTTYFNGGVDEASDPCIKQIRKKRPREYKRYYLYSLDNDMADKTVIHV